MSKIFKATCDKCKMPVVKGFDIIKTGNILENHKQCAYCNDKKDMTATVELLETENV